VGGLILIVGLALAAAAWFAIGVRQAEGTTQAAAIISSAARLSPAQASQAAGLLSSAAFLNPDRQVDVLRGQLDAARGDMPGARRILTQVVNAEPKNLGAWIALWKASAPRSREFYAAAYAILHLAPPVHGPR